MEAGCFRTSDVLDWRPFQVRMSYVAAAAVEFRELWQAASAKDASMPRMQRFCLVWSCKVSGFKP